MKNLLTRLIAFIVLGVTATAAEDKYAIQTVNVYKNRRLIGQSDTLVVSWITEGSNQGVFTYQYQKKGDTTGFCLTEPDDFRKVFLPGQNNPDTIKAWYMWEVNVTPR